VTPAGIQPAAANPSRIRPGVTSAIIVLVVIGLGSADRFLAQVESSEIRTSAQRAYATGSRFLEQGNPGAAVDSLREAHALERQNPEYEVQLIAALSAAAKTGEAGPLLTDILQREPDDGRANLIAARLMVKEGDMAEAEAHYHRAIYGQWSGEPATHRAATRMELIDLLATGGKKQELLAELIGLEAEASQDRSVQMKLAGLFIRADAPTRAVSVYQAIADKDPTDIAALEGLGNAEMQQGQYRAAHEAYLRVFLKQPNNATARAHLQILNTVTELDPTLRQLTSLEKYRRSVRILDMTRVALAQCLSKGPVSDADQKLLKSADATVSGNTPAHVTNEAAEGVLSQAGKLWHSETNCDGEKASELNALALIMKKLTS
jgi:Flp pilus assembly protein TadD